MIYIISKYRRGAENIAYDCTIREYRHVNEPEQMRGLRSVKYIMHQGLADFSDRERDEISVLLKALEWVPCFDETNHQVRSAS